MADIIKIFNLGIKNLRKVGNNVVSGPTLEGQGHILSKIKDAGIRTVVDFRTEATQTLEKECQEAGLKYFKIGLNHTICENKQMKVSNLFAQRLKEFIKIMNEGDAYIGCRYGVDRTNSGILLNYFLNPQSSKFYIPKLFPGTFERCSDIDNTIRKKMPKELINTLNKTVRKVWQSVKRMSPEQRAELGIPEDPKIRFEKLFKEKIGKLIHFNSNAPNKLAD